MSESDVNTSIILIENSSSDYPALTHAFRTLRNYVAKGISEQNDISKHASMIIPKTNAIILNVVKNPNLDESEELCHTVALQFLANYIVNNIENQKYVWDICKDAIRECLKCRTLSSKSKVPAAMILYTQMLSQSNIYVNNDDSFEDVIPLCTEESTAEIAVFILELLISNSEYVEKWYENLAMENRLLLLNVMCNMVEEGKRISNGVYAVLSNYFHRKWNGILITATESSELASKEIIELLNFFNAVSGNVERLTELQEHIELLEDAVHLLRRVHEISKMTGNNFSMLRKITDLQETVVDEQHVGFGLKCALIRLIGNLCYHSKRHQDQLRIMDGILLILDCTSIDGRNPLIIQWVILAMRNICENNIANQNVVASVDNRGVVDTNSLSELGIRLNSNDNGSGVGIAPLSAFKK